MQRAACGWFEWACGHGARATLELGRHLADLACARQAVLLREVLAHGEGRHSELAQRALDRLCACVAGAGQRHRITVQELSAPAAPVTVAHPIRARRREHAVDL